MYNGSAFKFSVQIIFKDNSFSEDGFKIERATGIGTPFAEIATSKPSFSGSLVFNDNGLSPNTTYVYRVRAFNGAGYSDYSAPITLTTTP
ncbi:fibronectin type III domain-containing protein [Candidatus Uhrbacteria bacterium]|nr:fibronectin type III domain-containing protein [Candidatus Uhrbacteria bacterium]